MCFKVTLAVDFEFFDLEVFEALDDLQFTWKVEDLKF
jgi:hypothetical protein